MAHTSQGEQAGERQRQFASDAAHELRTPLAALCVHLEEAVLYPDDADAGAALQEALRGAERLRGIVADLLLLAQLGTGTARDRIDLTELVTTETTRRSPARIHTVLEREITVLGTQIHLNRLLGNLLDNAERHAQTLVSVALHRREGYAVLTVADDGTGLPAKDRERVFGYFTRLDSARSRDKGGTGLGLTIAREVALAHHGTLKIEDSPRGARFVLCLPMAPTGTS